MGVRRHEVTLLFRTTAAFGPNNHCWESLFVRGLSNDYLHVSGNFVDLLLSRDAVNQILEVNDTADFGQDREGIRIPFKKNLIRLDGCTIFHIDLRAVHNRIALSFTLLLINDDQDAVAIHRDQFALVVANCVDIIEPNETVTLSVLSRLFADSSCRTTDVERTHGELSTRLTNRLSGDDTHRFTTFDHSSGGQIASIAEPADTTLRLAGEHRADFHTLDTGTLNSARQFLSDFLVHAN